MAKADFIFGAFINNVHGHNVLTFHKQVQGPCAITGRLRKANNERNLHGHKNHRIPIIYCNYIGCVASHHE